jgi:drug/metabolite transporter (DMT)-like permease
MAEAYGALTVGEAAIWLQLTPIAQVGLGALLLSERLPPLALAGVVVGVGGVAYGSVMGSRRTGGPPAVDAASGAGPG